MRQLIYIYTMKINFTTFILLFLVIFFSSCSKIIDFVPISVDSMLGKQFSTTFETTNPNLIVLDSSKNVKLYQYLNKIKFQLLSSNKIKHKKDFVWKLKVIKDDSTLNAFCISGGYIYIYTGIIKFLDNEAQLAGVMAHEIAHADNRHTTSQIIGQYGISMLISMFIGSDVSAFVQIGQELLGLSFSRSDEKQADEYAVNYMYNSQYDARQVGGFFEKMIQNNKESALPELFSTHPASENRVQEINEIWEKLGKKQGKVFENDYNTIKKLI